MKRAVNALSEPKMIEIILFIYNNIVKNAIFVNGFQKRIFE